MKQFYSYLWLREDTTPYYAGKGTGHRAFISFAHGVHCPPDRSRILVFMHSSEAEAFESEVAFIKWFGRKDLGTGCLRNLTDGGEGASGCKKSDETCRKQSKAMKGRVFSVAHRKRLSAALKGKKNSLGYRHSAEQIRKSSDRRRGQKRSVESRQKMSASAKLKLPMSEATRRKLSENLQGNLRRLGVVDSEETRRNKSEAAKRRGISPETRQKMAAGTRRGPDGRFFKPCLTDH